MKNAQIWKLKNSALIVKIEYTLYRMRVGGMTESDASVLWNGVRAPKGAKMLAVIKVKNNTKTCAAWALRKWTK